MLESARGSVETSEHNGLPRASVLQDDRPKKMGHIELVVFLALAGLTPILCQTTGVRPNLFQCYNASALPGVLTANGRPPVTVNILIEFIRKLEDANPTFTARELIVAILQRLRQDGIMTTGRLTDNSIGIPFSPKRLEAFKTTLILQRFLTNTSLELDYGDLDASEVCSLHYMISSTIDNQLRNDESSTCARSSRYTSRILRGRRDLEEETTEVPEVPEVANDDENVGDTENVEVEGVEGFGVRSILASSNDVSQCPVELGVMYTNYGTVKAGQVLAGIATGLNAETVLTCDNRYAATISGEIAEAALVQANTTIVVGVSGGWNSTINPRYYFLQRNMLTQVTDAEIRGSLDGLYMALKMDSWRSEFQDLKVSQILDMYYTQNKGVFDSSFRACNRNILYTEMTTTDTLLSEILNFMGPLDEASQYGQTVSPTAYASLTNAALSSFNAYLPQMNTTDLNCSPDNLNIERVATDLWIFLDFSWSYTTVQPLLSYILDNIDVNKFGTRYTLFNGRDGTNITTNSTSSLLDFYRQYNQTVHQNQNRDFDYATVVETVENVGRLKLNNNSYAGGESTIVVLMPRTTPNQDQNTLLAQRRELIDEHIPDLTILVVGTGNQADYSSIVSNSAKDVIILTETTSEDQIKQMGQNLIERIKNAPRAVINPSCTSEFNGASSTFSLTQYVEPRGVNYYRISPNYFFTGDGTKNLKITENSYGSIDVCISREDSRPNNQTSECETLNSAVKTIEITGYCGDIISSCSPIYISVTGNTTRTQCKDTLCRFPDDIKYTISLENVGCASSAFRIFANFAVLAVLFLLLGF
ncbi:hypothetical protein NQ318_016639 [Aromia moschata]|uniref:Uncharacterized protein n=1 Tax=Aromia moschata TaxID=1265417 RepID=A0AAV8XVJ9_9CUCU|nr:hypothetical protein NQ318_016639 [Aromia moschata]